MSKQIDFLYSLLPDGYLGKKIVLEHYQTVPDIIREMVKFHKKYMFDYDYISTEFYTGNIKQDLQNLWQFCKKNIVYEIESSSNQRLQSPAAILYNKKGDCKTMALFCGGVCSSWQRLGLYDLSSLNYVYASYDGSNIPGHVFIECNSWWCDPVLNSFDQRKKTTFTKKKSMLYGIAGIKNINTDTQTPGQLPHFPIKYHSNTLVMPGTIYTGQTNPTPEYNTDSVDVTNYNTGRYKRRIGDDSEDPSYFPEDPGTGMQEGIDSINEDGSIDYSNGSTLESDGTLYAEDGSILATGAIDYDPITGNIDYKDGSTLEGDGILYNSDNEIMGEGVQSYFPDTNTTDYINGVTLEGDGILYDQNNNILSTGVEDYNPLTGNIDYNDGYTVTGDNTLYDDNGDVVATDVIAYNPETGVVTYDGGNTETLSEIEQGGNKPGTPTYTPHNNSNGQPGKGSTPGSGGGSSTGSTPGGASTGISWPPKSAPSPTGTPGTIPVKHAASPVRGSVSASGLLSGNMPLILLGAGVLYLLLKPKN